MLGFETWNWAFHVPLTRWLEALKLERESDCKEKSGRWGRRTSQKMRRMVPKIIKKMVKAAE